jgi:hypothetical protein
MFTEKVFTRIPSTSNVKEIKNNSKSNINSNDCSKVTIIEEVERKEEKEHNKRKSRLLPCNCFQLMDKVIDIQRMDDDVQRRKLGWEEQRKELNRRITIATANVYKSIHSDRERQQSLQQLLDTIKKEDKHMLDNINVCEQEEQRLNIEKDDYVSLVLQLKSGNFNHNATKVKGKTLLIDVHLMDTSVYPKVPISTTTVDGSVKFPIIVVGMARLHRDSFEEESDTALNHLKCWNTNSVTMVHLTGKLGAFSIRHDIAGGSSVGGNSSSNIYSTFTMDLKFGHLEIPSSYPLLKILPVHPFNIKTPCGEMEQRKKVVVKRNFSEVSSNDDENDRIKAIIKSIMFVDHQGSWKLEELIAEVMKHWQCLHHQKTKPYPIVIRTVIYELLGDESILQPGEDHEHFIPL